MGKPTLPTTKQLLEEVRGGLMEIKSRVDRSAEVKQVRSEIDVQRIQTDLNAWMVSLSQKVSELESKYRLVTAVADRLAKEEAWAEGARDLFCEIDDRLSALEREAMPRVEVSKPDNNGAPDRIEDATLERRGDRWVAVLEVD